jgi:glutathione S-transferase
VQVPLRIVGVPASPYSRKLRAVLRYRRIPHAWIMRGSPESHDLPRPRVDLLPQLIVAGPDGAAEVRTDSTPLIRWLETTYEGRTVRPPDAVVAFLDSLIEDYADEWLTKAMFHYRWAFAPDVAQAAAILPRWIMPTASDADLTAGGNAFRDRQIGRLAVVGSSPTTASTIEASYVRLLGALDERLRRTRFVMGDRPGAADFALFGQLTQLAGFDPTSRAMALRIAPRVVAWVDLVDDLSGLEPREADWLRRDDAATALHPLLAEIGRIYAPFLLANAAALDAGADAVECTIDGRPWRQRPFPYQRKCLQCLREELEALSPADQAAARAAIDGTGCEMLFRR